MKILGVSAFYHDSAAALIENDEIIAAAQEERFTRKKQDESFPLNAINFCLEQSGFSLNELDAIVFYDKPLLKFERLLETYYGFAPKGLSSFLAAIPVWIREKMFLKKLIFDELKKVQKYDKSKLKLLFPEHHLSHAASAFYPSPYEAAAILTIDGVGEWSTASIGYGNGKEIKILKELHFPHSVGLLYSAFTYYTGFKVNSGEYKVMGLAPYGDAESEVVKEFIRKIKEYVVDIKEDGSVWLNQEYFNYSTGLKMINEKKFEKLFGFPTRKPETHMEQVHCDMAYAIQQVTEEIVIKMATHAKKLTGAKYLCMAGGVALNCVANGKLLDKGIYEDLFIQPAAGDAGGALGAALAAYHIHFDCERKVISGKDRMKGAYLGPEYSEQDIEKMGKKYKAVSHYFDDFEKLTDYITNLIEEGNVIGWFQGRMEYGPRALGNRSIVGDARNREMQKKLNLKIKYREGFRPFAPSVLAEENSNFFETTKDSPYMLLIADVKKERRKPLPENFSKLTLKERLYYERSDVQSITHLDFSARLQTVHKETNPKYWKLIDKFRQKTGYGILVNTSFNVRGEPIVCSPVDAYSCFMATEIDYLVLNNYVFIKTEQPDWQNKEKWMGNFKLD